MYNNKIHLNLIFTVREMINQQRYDVGVNHHLNELVTHLSAVGQRPNCIGQYLFVICYNWKQADKPGADLGDVIGVAQIIGVDLKLIVDFAWNSSFTANFGPLVLF